MVYNGNFVNIVELREMLIECGCSFNSIIDLEMIVLVIVIYVKVGKSWLEVVISVFYLC